MLQMLSDLIDKVGGGLTTDRPAIAGKLHLQDHTGNKLQRLRRQRQGERKQ
jgi:hypothetical protein